MPRHTLRLPMRSFSSAPHNNAQWICRRCLATQTTTPSPATSLPPHYTPKRGADEADGYDPTLPSSQRDYKLTKTDFYLKRKLPHQIPVQYLQHAKSPLLAAEERLARSKVPGQKQVVGVVVSSGKMDKTVKVRVPNMVWSRRVKKYFQSPLQHLVHDPNNSLETGDVVSLHRLRVSATVRHVVGSIITPFGTPLSSRPPIPTGDERLATYKEKRFAKLSRRTLRRRAAMGIEDAITALREMGLDPGKGTEAGKGVKENLQKNVGKKRTPSPTGAILGAKGQKLPEGVLPDGTHEVGKINARASKNKGRAMAFEEQAERNLLEAKVKGEELEKMGVGAESKVPTQGNYMQPPPAKE